MPQGDKSKYTARQKRMAQHIEKGYEERGTSRKEAERRAWATVNKETGGGNRSGSGRGRQDTTESSRKGGKVASRKKIGEEIPQKNQHQKAHPQNRLQHADFAFVTTSTQLMGISSRAREQRRPWNVSALA